MDRGEIHVYDVDMPEGLRCEIERLLAAWGYAIQRKEREIYINMEEFRR